jgi:DNA polymerase III delta prime subunit
MALYTDKYRPKYLDDFSFSNNTSKLLKYRTFFCKSDYSIQNMILVGQDGCGKKSRIYAFLRELFDYDVNKITATEYVLKYKNNKYNYVVYSSPYHIELNLTEHGINDFYVLKDFIKRIKDTNNIYTQNHRIILIPYFNKLTKKAQLYFRRTMEVNIEEMRFIFLSNTLLGIEDALKSRCNIIKITCPSYDEIKAILLDIIDKEGLYIPENEEHREKILKSIITPNRIVYKLYNLKECIKQLQLSFRNRDKSFILYKKHRNKLLKELVNIIKNSKIITKNILDKINEIIFELYTDNIDYQYILRYLTDELIPLFTKNDNIDLNPVLLALLKFSSETSINMSSGKHEIVALENFIYKIFKLKTLI